MSHDAMLRDLAAERLGDLLPLLRRAFETGYREGMATAGLGAIAPRVEVEVPGREVAAPAEVVEVVPPESAVAADAEGNDGPEDQDDPADDESAEELVEEVTPSNGEPARRRFRGIRANSTVGGLLKKIEQVFRVEERFDLVVRVEHPGSGRAPKRHMRLSAYAREG
jgi:hypothetical protein